MTFLGVMRRAPGGVWANDAADRALAEQIFGTRRVLFTEPHGFWYGVLEQVWPAANLLNVWEEGDPK